jgi:hypothetical protein
MLSCSHFWARVVGDRVWGRHCFSGYGLASGEQRFFGL